MWTGDPKQPEAQAVAVWRDRILKVGTDADVKALVGPNTKVIDLAGRRVVPGFIDSHAHVLGGGAQLSRVELKDAKDEAEFGRRLKEFDRQARRATAGCSAATGTTTAPSAASCRPPRSWTSTSATGRSSSSRYDGHMALANTVALKMAGITAKTKDPTGGVIYRLPDGRAGRRAQGQRDGPGG